MDGFVVSSAHGAVDSLLSRLATALTDEAQLLRGVRGDVRFIRDEMDSMNGLLLHLAALDDAGHHHHVRAWMRQIRDVANDSQACVNRYVRHLGAGGHRRRGGPLRHVRRACHLLWTLRARHQIATEIRELKVRAREVGERRKRYGITVPLIATGDPERAGGHKPPVPLPHAGNNGLADDARRLALEDSEGPVVSGEDARKLTKGLTEDAFDNRRLKVIPVVGSTGVGKSALAWQVYRHPSVTARFDCRAWCNVRGGQPWTDVAAHLLGNLETHDGVGVQWWDDDSPVRELKAHLKGRRFLLVVDGLEEQQTLEEMEETLQWCPYNAGSAVLVTTRSQPMVPSCGTYNILHLKTQPFIVGAFMDRALAMVPDMPYGMAVVLRKILSRFSTDTFYMKMLLHLLYVNPSRTMQELQGLSTRLADEEPLANAKQMFMFSYDDLPSHYKSCLLYLAIFPQGCSIKRKSLIRRWAVEGLIGKTDGLTALEGADRCFDALLDRGFIAPKDIGAAGKVKSCKLDASVHDFITWIARYDNFVDANLPSSLAPRLSIHHGIDPQQVSKKLHASKCNALGRIWCCYSAKKVSGCCDNIVVLLECLPSSPRLELLKVLDLEGCQGLKRDHLLRTINELSSCLRSLSIRIKEPSTQISVMQADPLFKRPPKFLESLSICGLTDELPYWIEDLHQLVKITLSETFLTENALRTLGQLKGLRCLRLRHNSFLASRLAFGESEFRNLKFLVIERTHITNISFSRKAAPKLEKIVWSFSEIKSISGIGYLERLKQFELNGSSIPDSIKEANAAYPNLHVFKYNLQS